MRDVLHRNIVLLLLVLSLFQAGCLSRRRVIPVEQRLLPAQTATRAELLQKLQDNSKAVERLTASVTLDASGGALTTGVLTEYRQTKGFIIVQRPHQIRIKALAPLALATVFDMVSDGKRFSVSIPVRNQFYEGDNDAPAKAKNAMANLRPQHIMAALFVDVTPYQSTTDVRSILEETIVGRNSYYVFSFIDVKSEDAQLIEKIWIDRYNMEVRRKEIFGKNGKAETNVEYTQYQSLPDGAPFPLVIDIRRPAEDYALKITFQKTAMNEALAADSFQLSRPEGAELVRLDEDAASQPN
jgi:outer membrane lipoprotein-sorting protein